MRIKNESKRTYCFNGGLVYPGRIANVDDDVALELVKKYPDELLALDSPKVVDSVNTESAAPKKSKKK